MKKTQFIMVGALGLSLAGPAGLQAADGPYKLLKEIHIGGLSSSTDYAAVDPAGRRLYVSHGTEVAVIDLGTDMVVGVISNTPGIHGVAIAADLGRGVTSNGRENQASIFDLKTLETITKVKTGANPDGLVYDPGQHEVYLFNGRDNSATVLDVKNAKVVATVPLGGKPEFPTVDVEAGRIYDNLEDKSAVAVIDTKTHSLVATWPIAPGEEASGMAIDLVHHRLFLGCGKNNMMVMMDSSNGKVVANVSIGADVDANAFDPGTQLAFASCGDGTTTIAHEDSPDKLTVVQTLKTENHAKTMALDLTTHKIYLAPNVRNAPANSFKVLVYEMQKP